MVRYPTKVGHLCAGILFGETKAAFSPEPTGSNSARRSRRSRSSPEGCLERGCLDGRACGARCWSRYLSGVSCVGEVEQLLDFVLWPAEIAPALISDELGGAERLVQPWFDGYPVASGGPPEPCGEGFLVSEREALDRTELGCEELRIAAPDPKHDKRTGVANDSRESPIPFFRTGKQLRDRLNQ